MSELAKIDKKFFDKIKEPFLSQSPNITKEDFNREVSFALQHIHNNPKLEDCDGASKLKAVLNVAQTGLTLNPVSKYAYLVPRYNGRHRTMEAVLEPSYIGLNKLLTDSGSVKKLECQLIWEGDDIEVDMASDKKILKHVPYFLCGNDKGQIRGVYSKAKLFDDSYHCEIMSRADVEEIRSRSESYKAYEKNKIPTCIWITDEAEMFRKTVLKRHFKYLPKTDQSKFLENAISLDNEIHGFDGDITTSFISYLENKIDKSKLNDKRKAELFNELYTYQKTSQGNKLSEYLEEYMPIMGLDEMPTRQYEVQEATRKAVERDDFKEK